MTGILRDSGRREEILAGFLKKGYWDKRGEVTKNKHLHSSGLEERFMIVLGHFQFIFLTQTKYSACLLPSMIFQFV